MTYNDFWALSKKRAENRAANKAKNTVKFMLKKY